MKPLPSSPHVILSSWIQIPNAHLYHLRTITTLIQMGMGVLQVQRSVPHLRVSLIRDFWPVQNCDDLDCWISTKTKLRTREEEIGKVGHHTSQQRVTLIHRCRSCWKQIETCIGEWSQSWSYSMSFVYIYNRVPFKVSSYFYYPSIVVKQPKSSFCLDSHHDLR